jgi:hypothetical protein
MGRKFTSLEFKIEEVFIKAVYGGSRWRVPHLNSCKENCFSDSIVNAAGCPDRLKSQSALWDIG